MAAPRAAEVLAHPPEEPSLDDLKREHGTDDEDELIYRAFLPQADIEKMRAAGPVKRDYPLLSSPELEQLSKLMELTRIPVLEVRSATMHAVLRR
jgi:oxaloacetate decarboxylase alpha subunit